MRIAFIALFAIGCSNHGSSHDDGPPTDASSTAVALQCESGGAAFPPLEKTCTVASDCFVALHRNDCCGTKIAIGLNQTSQVAFMTAEGSCAAAYPGCGCAQFPTEAEDGRTELVGAIEVRCEAALCRTYVP